MENLNKVEKEVKEYFLKSYFKTIPKKDRELWFKTNAQAQESVKIFSKMLIEKYEKRTNI